MGRKSKLEAGTKLTAMGLDNREKVSRNEGSSWQVDPDFRQHYILKDNISAAYTNLNHTFTEKTKLQA